MQIAVDGGDLLVVSTDSHEQLNAVTEILAKAFVSLDATGMALLDIITYFIGARRDGNQVIAYFATERGCKTVEQLTARATAELEA